ncbi:MAG TPA: four helix bundle protein [Vicinamibacterales bacterium]|jgi:four helix bundle protein
MTLPHYNLVAWQRADDLFVQLHRLSLKALPPFEKFELGGQLRRAAFSVPANIVEGFATSYGRRRLHFLRIARSSLAEVGYCIHVANRLGYLNDDDARTIEAQIRQVSAPLAGLIRSLSEREDHL